MPSQSQNGRRRECGSEPNDQLSRVLTQQNRRDEARSPLTEIYNWCTGGFDTRDSKDAKALLDQLAE